MFVINLDFVEVNALKIKRKYMLREIFLKMADFNTLKCKGASKY